MHIDKYYGVQLGMCYISANFLLYVFINKELYLLKGSIRQKLGCPTKYDYTTTCPVCIATG